ncbi:hypothetical protein A9Q96_14935 [Rhodobacterales bacterium 52_120_T64]|nr:hypothetical protein A9Q96_14935 [Rhodobacterales bacterium 52_120_T64]
MGSIKDYMIDQDIGLARWVSKVTLVCPECDDTICKEIDVPEPDYTAEKSRDMTVGSEVEIECDGCGATLESDVWAGPFDCDITLKDYAHTSVTCSSPGFDRPPEDWDGSWETPEHPGQIFDLNYEELHEIIDTQASADGGSLMNRMIFAQIITFLEAYFCDNLIKGLQNHRDCMIRFASKDGAIQNDPIPVADILRDPDVIEKRIVKKLKEGRLYHKFGASHDPASKSKPKLEGVPLWYRHAFDFSLTPTDDLLDDLRNYTMLRHDCVHRNGETKEGEKLAMFDKEYLLEALYKVKAIVEHIDGKMAKLGEPKTGLPNDNTAQLIIEAEAV